jgi:hypothetical protein
MRTESTCRLSRIDNNSSSSYEGQSLWVSGNFIGNFITEQGAVFVWRVTLCQHNEMGSQQILLL